MAGRVDRARAIRAIRAPQLMGEARIHIEIDYGPTP
jgi:hypothetical protein